MIFGYGKIETKPESNGHEHEAGIVHGNCFAKLVTGDAFTLLRFDTFFCFSQFIFDCCCHHFFCRYMTNSQLVLRNQSLNTSITITCYDCYAFFYFAHFVGNFFFHGDTNWTVYS